MRQLCNLFLFLFLLMSLCGVLAGVSIFIPVLGELSATLQLLKVISFALGLVLYLIMAFNSHLPKRLLLPLLAWLFWAAMGYWPLHSLIGSLDLLVASVLQLILITVLLKFNWQDNESSLFLVPSQFTGSFFSGRNLIIFILCNILLLPLALPLFGYAVADRLIEEKSAGFINLGPNGIYMKEKIYRRGDDRIRLIPMIHLAQSEYYQKLSESISAETTLILAEGVSDRQGLLRNRFDYGNLANLLGLTSQAHLDFPGRLISKDSLSTPLPPGHEGPDILPADIDLSEFDPRTIELLDALAEHVLNTDSPLTGYMEFNRWVEQEAPADIENIVMNDLLGKRNQALLSYLPAALQRYDTLIIPWGALHMKGIEQSLLERGFTLSGSQERLSINFRKLPYEKIARSLLPE